jgi:hypothetical protein
MKRIEDTFAYQCREICKAFRALRDAFFDEIAHLLRWS